MTAPTTTIRITHSWCPTCQAWPGGKARCGTVRGQSIWPAGVRTQACCVCRELHWAPCERCGEDTR